MSPRVAGTQHLGAAGTQHLGAAGTQHRGLAGTQHFWRAGAESGGGNRGHSSFCELATTGDIAILNNTLRYVSEYPFNV